MNKSKNIVATQVLEALAYRKYRTLDDEIPIIVVDTGDKTYKDGFGNSYKEIDLSEKEGKWVFEKVWNVLVSRYVKKAG